MPEPGRPSPERAVGVWHVASAVALALVYAPLVRQLVFLWRNDPYAGHGMFVPLYSVFLLWADRDRLRAIPRGSDPRGLSLVLLAVGLLALGARTSSLSMQGISLVFAVAGSVLWGLGGRFLRAAVFPVLFLSFMLPLPRSVVDAVSPDLQVFVAGFAATTLGFLGIPCYQRGVLIELPAMTLEIAEICNGLRFLLALVTLTAAFAHVSQRSPFRRVVLVASAVPLAVLANAIRIAAIAIAAHYAGPAAASGWTHHLIGKSVWALTLVPIVAIGLLLRREEERTARRPAARLIPSRSPEDAVAAGTGVTP